MKFKDTSFDRAENNEWDKISMQMHGGLLRRKKLQPELRNINA